MTYLRSPMNYMGGKHKLLPQLLPLLPASSRVFVDLFAGGLDVSLNTVAATHICVDLNAPVIALYQALQAKPVAEVLAYVESRVKHFGLSMTNTSGYLRLREEYNKAENPLDLFVLVAHSFNHQARFNSSHQFNTPFGKDRSYFNPVMRVNLVNLVGYLQSHEFEFQCSDFRQVPLNGMGPSSFLYADPPYLISSGTYNDGTRGFGGWGYKDDSDLMGLLDALDERGVLWAMSNVTHHKGASNKRLIAWAKKYRVHVMEFNYNNSNYQSAAAGAKTREVLITNYPGSPILE